MEINGKFADRLKTAIRAKGLSYESLSNRLGISPKTLSRYVLGERLPRIDTAADFARELQVDPLWLQGYDVPETEDRESSDIPEGETKAACTNSEGEADKAANTASSDNSEKILLSNYRALNSHGKVKAIAYISTLVGMLPAEQTTYASRTVAPQDEQSAFVPILGPLPGADVLSSKPLTPEKVENIARSSCEGSDFKWLGMRQTSNIASINIMVSPGKTGDHLFSDICSCTADILAGLFTASQLKTISCFFKPSLEGGEGEIAAETMARIVISRVPGDIYGSIKESVKLDYNELLKIADEYYISPEFRGELSMLRY